MHALSSEVCAPRAAKIKQLSVSTRFGARRAAGPLFFPGTDQNSEILHTLFKKIEL